MSVGPIPEERRMAARKELRRLHQELNRAIQCVTNKVMYLSLPEPKWHSKAVGDMRISRRAKIIISEQLADIEARLLGTTTKAVKKVDHARMTEAERRRVTVEAREGYIEGSLDDYHLLHWLRGLSEDRRSYFRSVIAQEFADIAIREAEAANEGREPQREFQVIEGGAS